MIPLIITTLSVLSGATQADRLAAYISKRQPLARSYARLLASQTIAAGKRHSIKPATLLAVAWVESRFKRCAKGKAGEYGLWQLRPRDARMARGWAWLQRSGLVPGFPVSPWRQLSLRVKRRALHDIKVSAELAATELAAVRAWCRRAGHRIGRGARRWVKGADGVNRLTARRHGHWIDRFGHHQTGGRWPRGYYVRGLRREYSRIRRAIQ